MLCCLFLESIKYYEGNSTVIYPGSCSSACMGSTMSNIQGHRKTAVKGGGLGWGEEGGGGCQARFADDLLGGIPTNEKEHPLFFFSIYDRSLNCPICWHQLQICIYKIWDGIELGKGWCCIPMPPSSNSLAML